MQFTRPHDAPPRNLPQIVPPSDFSALRARCPSFVKTLKRDYARLNVLTDAAAILAMLPDWIEDYCQVHPHSGLKFRSPREFIRLSV